MCVGVLPNGSRRENVADSGDAVPEVHALCHLLPRLCCLSKASFLDVVLWLDPGGCDPCRFTNDSVRWVSA